MRRMAKAHRPARNDHIHRNARLGSRRSAAMTLGITRDNPHLSEPKKRHVSAPDGNDAVSFKGCRLGGAGWDAETNESMCEHRCSRDIVNLVSRQRRKD